jgi:uncharacterized membrane protein YphA (DoxX/SURF4 family)
MSLRARLDVLHAHLRASPFFFRLTLGTRLLLAMGFIPTGMVKIAGRRFTTIPTSDPIGLLFETLYQGGGLYWRFLGGVQVTAGILILIPATATLGAILFFPLMLNIFAITVSYGFGNTRFITGPMVLAALYLLCWDYDRLRPVIFTGTYGDGLMLPSPVRRLCANWEVLTYWIGAVAGIGFFWTLRFPAPDFLPLLLLVATTMSALVAGAGAVRVLISPAGGPNASSSLH